MTFGDAKWIAFIPGHYIWTKKRAGYAGMGEGITWILLSLSQFAPEVWYAIQIAEWVQMLVNDKDRDFPVCWIKELWNVLDNTFAWLLNGLEKGTLFTHPTEDKGTIKIKRFFSHFQQKETLHRSHRNYKHWRKEIGHCVQMATLTRILHNQRTAQDTGGADNRAAFPNCSGRWSQWSTLKEKHNH